MHTALPGTSSPLAMRLLDDVAMRYEVDLHQTRRSVGYAGGGEDRVDRAAHLPSAESREARSRRSTLIVLATSKSTAA